MSIKLSGLNSGMDTESIIQELVKAKSEKKVKLEGLQKKHEWKQEAWKELNSKIYSLYSKTLSNMRLPSEYTKKATKSSSDAVTVLTGLNAPNCVQTLKINSMAKTGYLTGAELGNGEAGYKSTTKVMDILKTSDYFKDGDKEEVSFYIQSGDSRKEIKIDSKTTIDDVVKTMREAGVNANFDETNQRFFISAKETGKDSDFALTANNIDGLEALASLGIAASLDTDANTKATYEKYASASVEEREKLIADAIAEEIKSAGEKLSTAQNTLAEIQNEKANKVAEANDKYSDNADKLAEELAKIDAEYAERIKEQQDIISEVNSYYTPASGSAEATISEDKKAEIRAGFEATIANVSELLEWYETNKSRLASTRIEGVDASITLNGATYEAKRNNFEINGLTITINKMTDEEISLTTADDTDGIYDMIKGFLKEYNTLINEMDKLYNADSANKYDMLTDEEREALSEDDAKEWDEKIKSALLRRDSTLGNVFESMKMVMLQGVTMSDGSKMYLSELGINTLGYFNAPEHERSAYHIDGDADDTNTSANQDKLKAAIASDPDRVAEFFSKLALNLYNRLDDLMARTELSSAFTVYNDKAMQEEYNNYKEKIADQEEKITEFEDRYYDKFSKMETAMAKLNSQQSALSGLFS